MPADARFSIAELAAIADVTPRTVRYYVAQGLLPSVGQVGPGAKYSDGHLARLRLIRRLQREHLPLAEIRRRLEDLDDDEVALLADAEVATPSGSALDYVRSLLSGGAAGGSAGAPPAPSVPQPFSVRAPLRRIVPTAPAAPVPVTPQSPAPDASMPAGIERSQWERIVLAADVELHVRRPLSRTVNKRVDRLVTIARELLEEDRS
jgi:DNA-binding transcriptional MerR regulator